MFSYETGQHISFRRMLRSTFQSCVWIWTLRKSKWLSEFCFCQRGTGILNSQVRARWSRGYNVTHIEQSPLAVISKRGNRNCWRHPVCSRSSLQTMVACSYFVMLKIRTIVLPRTRWVLIYMTRTKAYLCSAGKAQLFYPFNDNIIGHAAMLLWVECKCILTAYAVQHVMIPGYFWDFFCLLYADAAARILGAGSSIFQSVRAEKPKHLQSCKACGKTGIVVSLKVLPPIQSLGDCQHVGYTMFLILAARGWYTPCWHPKSFQQHFLHFLETMVDANKEAVVVLQSESY